MMKANMDSLLRAGACIGVLVLCSAAHAQLVPRQEPAAKQASEKLDSDKKTITLKSGTVVVIDRPVLVADASKPTSDAVEPLDPKKRVVVKAQSPSKSKSATEPSEAVLNLPITAGGKKPPQAQEVPGLGTIPGTAADYQIKSVRVGADRNELVYVSLQQLNKITTPFETPQAVDTSGATLKAIGQDIFIKPANELPLTIYVSDAGVGQSIGITLVPKANLPAQTIVLVPDRPTVAGGAASANAPDMVAPDYTGRLIGLAKSLGSGGLPQGFAKSKLPRAIANDGKAIFEPQYKYVGSVYDVYSYVVKSMTPEPVELNEESFYSESVRAVAFYPKTMLQQDETTTVFVIVDRDAMGVKK